jgi:hypothetical protein
MVAQLDRIYMRARPWKIWSRLLAYVLFEGRPLTTRGRWINPLVMAGHRLWSVLPLGKSDLNPIFILGTGRSGTTILGTILGLHRDVGYLNEPKALWHAALGDDDLIGSYSAQPGRFRMGQSDVAKSKTRRLVHSYGAFLRLTRSRRVVDKYPELIFRLGFLNATFPGAKQIILLRNGADTIQSIQNWSDRNGVFSDGVAANWWGLDGQKWCQMIEQLVVPDPYFAAALPSIRALKNHIDMAAVEWIVTMREAMRVIQGTENLATNNLFVIHYEELVKTPEPILTALFKHCDLNADPVVAQYAAVVLKPRPAYGPMPIDAAIRPLFAETMHQLGYGTKL